MPELNNIETYKKLINYNFKPTLERFRNCLMSIGLWNNKIKAAFNDFKWNIEDGFVYSSLAELGYFTSKFSTIKIRPHVTVYTPAVDKLFTDNWIGCALLIEAQELRDSSNGLFHSYAYDLIETLTFEMQKEFKQAGIYFTDEAQDGSDFDGVRCSDFARLWQFEYALIPLTLEKLYSWIPTTHSLKRHENYLEAWYTDRWKDENESKQ